MKKIEILDCTLRDGGYINQNNFGYNNIKEIIKKLETANIDIIECGYLLDDKNIYSKDKTEYRNIEELHDQKLINDVSNHNYTLMILGEKYNIENLPISKDNQNNMIRMSFHKHGLPKAIDYANEIIKRGYRLFLQPTVIMNYKEEEIVAMLEIFNTLDIEGVAIVDTFGQMIPNDIIRITQIFDKYLSKDIKLCFHAHNNLQMAFSNAITFITTASNDRNLVIDTSLYGMGRGAGNLPTELLANYLNENYEKHYDILPLLEINDTIIEKIKNEHSWGYSLPYYLSARYACHPSYVLYLLNKKMLDSSDINKVLQMISNEKVTEYDKDYIEELYLTYNEKSIDDSSTYEQLKKVIENKEIVLVGPGKSIIECNHQIKEYIDNHDCFVINVNNPKIFEHDAVFYSNKKRYMALHEIENNKIEIITSNITIKKEKNKYIFDYNNSLSRKDGVSDSALLILLSILEKAEVKKITLAGFDGYNINEQNYYDNDLAYMLDKNYIDDLNKIIKRNIEKYQDSMIIDTITLSKNIKGEYEKG